MTKKLNLMIVKFVTIITLIIGGFVILYSSFSLIKTGCELAAINDDIRFYNEQAHKSDSMTIEVEKLIKLRNDKYYNSDDPIVRFFSNLPTLVKVLVIMLTVVLSLLVIYTWIHYILAAYFGIKASLKSIF